VGFRKGADGTPWVESRGRGNETQSGLAVPPAHSTDDARGAPAQKGLRTGTGTDGYVGGLGTDRPRPLAD
jgi:hypothetical protein